MTKFMSQKRVVKSCAAGEPPAFMIGGWGFCSGFGWLQTETASKLSLLKSNSSSSVHAPPHELEPLGGVFVTIIVRTHLRAEHVEFVLEPSANHVHGEPAVSDVIDRGRHLGHHQWMYQRHMHGGEYGAIVRHRADRGGPGEAFECAIVEVRWAAVAFPAPHRQQGLPFPN